MTFSRYPPHTRLGCSAAAIGLEHEIAETRSAWDLFTTPHEPVGVVLTYQPVLHQEVNAQPNSRKRATHLHIRGALLLPKRHGAVRLPSGFTPLDPRLVIALPCALRPTIDAVRSDLLMQICDDLTQI
jgi:hypothetical protein